MTDAREISNKGYLNNLRLLATLAVILLHISAEICHRYFTIPTAHWLTANLIDSATRFCVPVFIMISGALNLQPEKPFGLKKRLSTVLSPFLFWSIIYILWLHFVDGLQISKGLLGILQSPVYYHLWFVYIIAGLYLLTPVLRLLTANKKATEYFLLVWLIFSVVIPFFGHFINYTPYLNLNFLDGYIGLYLLGYYLDRHVITAIKNPILTTLFILSAGFTALVTWVATYQANIFDQFFLAYQTPNVVLISVAVFLWAKNSSGTSKIAEKLGKAGYHVYLGHALFLTAINLLIKNNYPTLTIHPFIEIPAKFMAVAVASYITAFLLVRVGSFEVLQKLKNRVFYIVVLAITVGFIAITGKETLQSFYQKTVMFNLPPLQAQQIDLKHYINGNSLTITRQDLHFVNGENKIIKIVVPVSILGYFEPKSTCQFYIPNYKTHETSLTYKTFDSLDWNGDNFGIAKTDTFGQLVCRNVTEIRIKTLASGIIYIFKI